MGRNHGPDKVCDEPGIGTTSAPWCNSQASVSWPGVQLCFFPNNETRSKRILFFSRLSPWNRGYRICSEKRTKTHNFQSSSKYLQYIQKTNVGINGWEGLIGFHVQFDSLSLRVSQQQLSQRRILGQAGYSIPLQFQDPCRKQTTIRPQSERMSHIRYCSEN